MIISHEHRDEGASNPGRRRLAHYPARTARENNSSGPALAPWPKARTRGVFAQIVPHAQPSRRHRAAGTRMLATHCG